MGTEEINTAVGISSIFPRVMLRNPAERRALVELIERTQEEVDDFEQIVRWLSTVRAGYTAEGREIPRWLLRLVQLVEHAQWAPMHLVEQARERAAKSIEEARE